MARGNARRSKATVKKGSGKSSTNTNEVNDQQGLQGDGQQASGNVVEASTSQAAAGNETNTPEPVDGYGDLDRDIEEELGELLDIEDEVDVWTPGKEDKLIDLYEKCTFLYDKASPGFNQRNRKDLAFKKIAEILGVNVKDVLTRVKSLRTTYARLKKGPPSGSGGDKRLTARKAHLFKRLAFLHPHTRTRASKSTLTIDMQDEEDESDESSDEDDDADDDQGGAGVLNQVPPAAAPADLPMPPANEVAPMLNRRARTPTATVTLASIGTEAGDPVRNRDVDLDRGNDDNGGARVLSENRGARGQSDNSGARVLSENRGARGQSENSGARGQSSGAPKKGYKTKSRQKRTNDDAEETRQTEALEKMVTVVEGAVGTKKAKTAKEEWCGVILHRSTRMTQEVADEFQHLVEQLSYDALRFQGHFQQFHPNAPVATFTPAAAAATAAALMYPQQQLQQYIPGQPVNPQQPPFNVPNQQYVAIQPANPGNVQNHQHNAGQHTNPPPQVPNYLPNQVEGPQVAATVTIVTQPQDGEAQPIPAAAGAMGPPPPAATLVPNEQVINQGASTSSGSDSQAELFAMPGGNYYRQLPPGDM